jgi:hypothetical protein
MPKPDILEFNPEFRLLLASVLHPLQEPEIEHLQTCCNPTIDWSAFLSLVKRHRVTPTVYLNLRVHAAESVPEQVLASLKNRDERNRQRILQILATLSDISEWFAVEGIKLCPLKGPLQAQSLFDDIGMRTSTDLDLLIPLESLEKADEQLLAHGCERTYPTKPLTPRQWQVYQQEWYHYSYFFPKRGIHIELHWTIGPPDLIPLEFAGQIRSRAHPMEVSGRTLYSLADEDFPVYLLIHGSRHNWVRLKWLVDFAVWMRRTGDQAWEDLILRMEEIGLARSLAQGVLLAHRMFSIPIPKQALPLITKEAINEKLARHSIEAILNPDYTGEEVGQFEHLQYILYSMKLKKDLRYKWSALTKIWITPEDWQDLPLPDFLFPLYWPLRPFLWLWRNHLRKSSNQ